MAEPFKNLLNRSLIAQTAAHLRRVWPAFAHRRFVALAEDGLDALEMKARAMQIASALEATLPEDFGTAAGIVEAALAPPAPGDDLSLMTMRDAGLAGWVVWPLGEWVVRRGLHQPQRALACLRELTQRHTAEWAVRPFIEAHPDLSFAELRRWCDDASPHVRRLVSEGSRPRLPWGMQLRGLIADPSPTLPLLERLQDDPSEYVRRSVANHLNDIAKDHPATVADWLERHLPEASAERRALLRHASRTLVKKGDRRVLALWGVGSALKGQAALRITPARVALGGAVRLELVIGSASSRAQALAIDYTVHHVRADGSTSAKVFKGWQLTLPPRETLMLARQHSLRPVTTRRYYAGSHRVELLINGRTEAAAAFQLRVS